MRDCPFCHTDQLNLTHEGKFWVAFLDKFPVSEGHTLIIPRKHCPGWAELSKEERQELVEMVDRVQASLSSSHSPEAFNVGWNDGAQAGQTVFHFHVHVIPRYAGDVPDPRGGVRWVLPGRACYWDDK